MSDITITKECAKSLAVDYHAFMQAIEHGNDGSIICWGKLLIESQAATGIELLSEVDIDQIVQNAQKRIHEQRQ